MFGLGHHEGEANMDLDEEQELEDSNIIYHQDHSHDHHGHHQRQSHHQAHHSSKFNPNNHHVKRKYYGNNSNHHGNSNWNQFDQSNRASVSPGLPPALSQAALDAAARKKLPAWIREGLEKMEREKVKKEEAEIRAKLR